MRYIGVTGVQTCALPIWRCAPRALLEARRGARGLDGALRVGHRRDLLRRLWPRLPRAQIGRASCWERAEISVFAVSLKKKIFIRTCNSLCSGKIVTLGVL